MLCLALGNVDALCLALVYVHAFLVSLQLLEGQFSKEVSHDTDGLIFQPASTVRQTTQTAKCFYFSGGQNECFQFVVTKDSMALGIEYLSLYLALCLWTLPWQPEVEAAGTEFRWLQTQSDHWGEAWVCSLPLHLWTVFQCEHHLLGHRPDPHSFSDTQCWGRATRTDPNLLIVGLSFGVFYSAAVSRKCVTWLQWQAWLKLPHGCDRVMSIGDCNQLKLPWLQWCCVWSYASCLLCDALFVWWFLCRMLRETKGYLFVGGLDLPFSEIKVGFSDLMKWVWVLKQNL